MAVAANALGAARQTAPQSDQEPEKVAGLATSQSVTRATQQKGSQRAQIDGLAGSPAPPPAPGTPGSPNTFTTRPPPAAELHAAGMASAGTAGGAGSDAPGPSQPSVLPECPVCMNAFNVLDRKPLDLGCGHCFCARCVLGAPRSFTRCPECRASVSRQPHVSVTLMRLIQALQPNGPPAAAEEPTGASASAGPSGAQQQQQSGHAAAGGGTWQATLGALASRLSSGQHATAGASGAWPQYTPTTASGGRGRSSGLGAAAAAAPGRPGGGGAGAGAGVARPTVAQAAVFNQARSQVWDVMIMVMGFLYTIMPLDIIPDFIPLLGWMDDLAVVLFVAWTAYSMIKAQRGGR